MESNVRAGLEPGKALDLLGHVHEAEGSIVSRVLLKTPQGSVTLFAFEAGQALSEHIAPFDALVHVLEGALELTVDGKPVAVAAGQTALMPAGVPHAVTAPQKSKWFLTMLKS